MDVEVGQDYGRYLDANAPRESGVRYPCSLLQHISWRSTLARLLRLGRAQRDPRVSLTEILEKTGESTNQRMEISLLRQRHDEFKPSSAKKVHRNILEWMDISLASLAWFCEQVKDSRAPSELWYKHYIWCPTIDRWWPRLRPSCSGSRRMLWAFHNAGDFIGA